MAVTISPSVSFTAVETLDVGVDAVTSPDVIHSAFNLTGVLLNATSTAPVSVTSYQQYALVAGALTIDLTALLGVNDESQDGTGLKLQTILIRNPAGNNPITIGDGAANGYQLFGAAVDVVIPAGATMAFYVPETLPDVGAAAKDIGVSGTGTETFDVGITLG